MEICSKCGAMMLPKKVDDKMMSVCMACGHKKGASGSGFSESAKKKEDISVVEENEGQTNAVVDAECPKCGHKKAEFWITQTRASDEAPTRFHKCVKCKNTWREY